MPAVSRRPYRPYKGNSSRICAYTFVKEQDLPPGQHQKQFIRCLDCRETFYVDLDAQLKDWPAHSQVCCSIDEDDPRIHIALPNLQACLDVMEECCQNGFSGRLPLHAMQEFKRLLNKPEQARQVWGLYSAEMLTSNFFRLMSDLGTKVWSVPGFASYLFSEDAFLSPCLLRRSRDRQQGTTLPRADDGYTYFDDLMDTCFGGGVITMIVSAQVPFRISADVRFNDWFEAVAFQDGAEPRRAASVIRHFMSLWPCFHGRSGQFQLFDGKASVEIEIDRNQFFSTVFFEAFRCNGNLAQWTEAHEAVPGMTLSTFAVLLFESPNPMGNLGSTMAHIYDRLYLIKQITEASNSVNASWGLSPSDRVMLLGGYSRWLEIPIQRYMGKSRFVVHINGLFRETFLRLFTGDNNTKFLLQMHQDLTLIVVSPEENSNEKNQTVRQLVKSKRRALMNATRPSLMEYLQCIDDEYRSKTPCGAPPFPEDVIPLVLSYALPNDSGFIISQHSCCNTSWSMIE